MKRFVVEQNGFIQVEASRRFLVEVPDHISEEEARKTLEDLQDRLPDNEGMEWRDEPDRNWVGYDVEIEGTEVYDPDTEFVAPATEGLIVIKLDGLDKP